jgi:hypothetical protein
MERGAPPLDFRFNSLSPTAVGIELRGVLNEDAEVGLTKILSELKNFSEVHVSFENVSAVNSLGVRAWVNFMRGAQDGGRTIIFYRCSPDVVSQINMIPSFVGSAMIASFFVNYICPKCEHSEVSLVETKSLKPGQVPKEPQCSQCQSPMETEELEDEYFAFLLQAS